MDYKIPLALIQALSQYLNTQPHGQVRGLFDALQNLKPSPDSQ